MGDLEWAAACVRRTSMPSVCKSCTNKTKEPSLCLPLSGFRCLAAWKSFLIWFDLIHSCGMGLHFLHFLHGNGEQVTGFQHQGFFSQRICPQYSISSETGIAAVYTITELSLFCVMYLRSIQRGGGSAGGLKPGFTQLLWVADLAVSPVRKRRIH